MSPYILQNRALIEGVKEASAKLGIACTLFSGDWAIQLQKNGTKRFIYAYGFDCNNQASSNIGADKVACSQLLQNAELPAVPHYLLNSIGEPQLDEALFKQLLSNHGRLVVKPIRGGRGMDIRRFSDAPEALRFMKQNGGFWACSPYMQIEREIRVVVFNGVVQLAYEKIEPQTLHGLKMFNLNLGAKPQTLSVEDLDYAIKELAVKALEAIGLHFAAVDIVIDQTGQTQVLEINSGFSLEHYAVADASNRSAVVELYKHVVQTMFSETD